jgi:hypothetical protein
MCCIWGIVDIEMQQTRGKKEVAGTPMHMLHNMERERRAKSGEEKRRGRKYMRRGKMQMRSWIEWSGRVDKGLQVKITASGSSGFGTSKS